MGVGPSLTLSESMAKLKGNPGDCLWLWTLSPKKTDYRPLEHIYAAKPTNSSKPQPARIERWHLHLQEYDFKVVYRLGKTNLADPLSRLSNQQQTRSNTESCADRYVNDLTTLLAPRAMSVEEIQQASLEDPELPRVWECLSSNQIYKMNQP